MTDKTVEAVARANCFANCVHIGRDGELILERDCSCKTEANCFEINGPLREEMLGQAKAAIAAHLKSLEAEGKLIISESNLQEIITNKPLYEG